MALRQTRRYKLGQKYETIVPKGCRFYMLAKDEVKVIMKGKSEDSFLFHVIPIIDASKLKLLELGIRVCPDCAKLPPNLCSVRFDGDYDYCPECGAELITAGVVLECEDGQVVNVFQRSLPGDEG